MGVRVYTINAQTELETEKMCVQGNGRGVGVRVYTINTQTYLETERIMCKETEGGGGVGYVSTP